MDYSGGYTLVICDASDLPAERARCGSPGPVLAEQGPLAEALDDEVAIRLGALYADAPDASVASGS